MPGKNELSIVENLQFFADYISPFFADSKLIGLNFFVGLNDESEYFSIRKQISDIIGHRYLNLPYSVLAQAAETSVNVELWMHDAIKDLQYSNIDGINYAHFKDTHGEHVLCLGACTPIKGMSLEDQIKFSFNSMLQVLESLNMTMDHVIRQWNYIPGILKINKRGSNNLQNYQVFNDLRQYFYVNFKSNREFPAATGVGMKNGPVTIDFLASKTSGNQNKGITNPLQVRAYQYDDKVLVGETISEDKKKKAPLFERARYYGFEENGMVYISGTASIVGQKTVGINNIRKQVSQTLLNIKELISPENLEKNLGYELRKDLKMNFMRVYIKDSRDFNIVKEICEAWYPNTQFSYVQSDICREDLLVEIEGESYI